MKFQPMVSAPESGPCLLLLGETIPDLADVRVGTYLTGVEASEIGYDEYKTGAWMIWNDCDDWYCVGKYDPRGWFPLPDTGGRSGMKLAKSPAMVIEG